MSEEEGFLHLTPCQGDSCCSYQSESSMTGTLYPAFSFSWSSTPQKNITLHSTQSKPLPKIAATIECRIIQFVRCSVSVNLMGAFLSYSCFYHVFIPR